MSIDPDAPRPTASGAPRITRVVPTVRRTATRLLDRVRTHRAGTLPTPGAKDYTAAFADAPVGMALTDLDGVLLAVNPALSRLLGVAPADLAGSTLFDVTHPDDLCAASAACSLLREGPATSAVVPVRLRGAGAAWVPVRVSTATIRATAGHAAHLVMHVEDETAHHALAEQLRLASLHDPLTRLPNRTLFLERLAHGATRHRRTGSPLSVLFCDVDDFAAVNNRHGHHAGDAVLVAVADRLRETVRPGDTVARLGGDELAVIAEGADAARARIIAQRVAAVLATPVSLDDRAIEVTVSIGSATSDGPVPDPADLLREADGAMYRAKLGRPPG
ncbi:hypothetical protein GCM10027047_00940 [Rhodococcus aerolatus]